MEVLQMLLKDSKGWLRAYLRTFTYQELCDTYAKNADGLMEFRNEDRCIRGVRGNYDGEASTVAQSGEVGYKGIGLTQWCTDDEGARRRRLSAILRAEMRRRSRHAEDEPAFTDPAQPDVYTPEEIAHAIEA